MMNIGIIRKDDSGVSEVIGALMLTLIVVASLSAFFLFIDDQQDKQQRNEMLKNKIEDEEILISDIDPFDDGSDWTKIAVYITSEWIEDSWINSVKINDNHLKRVWSFDESDPGTPTGTIDLTNELDIESRDTIEFLILLNRTEDFYDTLSHLIDMNNYIKIDITTGYHNIVSRTFTPPTAILKVDSDEYWDSTSSDWASMVVVDGTRSYTPDENSYIVNWNWEIINDADDDDNYTDNPSGAVTLNIEGAKSRIDDDISLDSDANLGVNNKITLTVIDNNGLSSKAEYVYYFVP